MRTNPISTLKSSINWKAAYKLGLLTLGVVTAIWLLLVVLSALSHVCLTVFGKWIGTLLMAPLLVVAVVIIDAYIVPVAKAAARNIRR